MSTGSETERARVEEDAMPTDLEIVSGILIAIGERQEELESSGLLAKAREANDFAIVLEAIVAKRLEEYPESALRTFAGPDGAAHLKRIMLKFKDHEDLKEPIANCPGLL